MVTLIKKWFINALTQVACYFPRMYPNLKFLCRFLPKHLLKIRPGKSIWSIRTDGRTTDRGDAATNCCSPVNRNCTTLCSHLVCCCNTTDSCTAPDVQLCAVPAGVVGNVACWRSYVHVNAVCKLIFNRDSVDRR